MLSALGLEEDDIESPWDSEVLFSIITIIFSLKYKYRVMLKHKRGDALLLLHLCIYPSNFYPVINKIIMCQI